MAQRPPIHQPVCSTTRSDSSHSNPTRWSSMDGVGAGCLRFAVRLTPPHARLAYGCWPSSTGWDCLPTGLQRKVSELIVTSRPPIPSFSWRNTKNAPRAHKRAVPRSRLSGRLARGVWRRNALFGSESTGLSRQQPPGMLAVAILPRNHRARREAFAFDLLT